VLSLLVFVVIDPAELRAALEQAVSLPGDRVERPTDPVFYGLEATILGLSGSLLLVAAVLLGAGRERTGIMAATIGLVIALTAGALVSLYVEQVSAILSTVVHGALLFAVVHYRNRFEESGPMSQGAPAGAGATVPASLTSEEG
jgi:hypothetical protein